MLPAAPVTATRTGFLLVICELQWLELGPRTGARSTKAGKRCHPVPPGGAKTREIDGLPMCDEQRGAVEAAYVDSWATPRDTRCRAGSGRTQRGRAGRRRGRVAWLLLPRAQHVQIVRA